MAPSPFKDLISYLPGAGLKGSEFGAPYGMFLGLSSDLQYPFRCVGKWKILLSIFLIFVETLFFVIKLVLILESPCIDYISEWVSDSDWMVHEESYISGWLIYLHFD